jgi:hypothetical protein
MHDNVCVCVGVCVCVTDSKGNSATVWGSVYMWLARSKGGGVLEVAGVKICVCMQTAVVCIFRNPD